MEISKKIKMRNNFNIIKKKENDSKYLFGLITGWYYEMPMETSIYIENNDIVNVEILSSRAIGTFNTFTRGKPIERWQNRHIDEIVT